jgi:hypothetical protein
MLFDAKKGNDDDFVENTERDIQREIQRDIYNEHGASDTDGDIRSKKGI